MSGDFRYWHVTGTAYDKDMNPVEIDRLVYALKDEALDRALIEQEYDMYDNANHTLEWQWYWGKEPIIALRQSRP